MDSTCGQNADFISVKENFGDLHPGQNYKVVDRQNDWVKVRCRGVLQYVPNYLVDRPIVRSNYEEEDDISAEGRYDTRNGNNAFWEFFAAKNEKCEKSV